MSPSPPARFATPATDRESYGGAVAETARRLGIILMDWQRQVTDVATEHGAARLAYRDIAVSVPRQQGKTTLILAVFAHRMLSAPRQTVVYGAQSRLAARQKLFDEWWPRLDRSPLRGMFTLSRATGAETLRCVNGSRLTLLSAEESSGHGDSTDLAILDEAWSLDDSAEQAVRPAMVTRANAQLWTLSTAGTEKSLFWRAKVDAGRTSAELAITDGSAYFEWSAEDGADPTDPSTWRACMPALGVTIEESTVLSDLRTMRLDKFRRSHLNQWPDESDEGWQVIARDVWNAARL